MTPESGKRWSYFICFIVISIAVTGYFTGLQSPMNPGAIGQAKNDSNSVLSDHARDVLGHSPKTEDGVVPATDYSAITNVTNSRANSWRTSILDLKSRINLNQEVVISEQEKLLALAMREQNRAFNGAPPTIPHPVEQLNAASCMACHGEGAKLESLRISKMSHQFLENCTQCHVESNPQHMAAALFRENSFSGLPAPEGGPRSFKEAPPMIPHSTWMRVDCLSCHGPTGVYGIRSTHPWRQSCQQCHAPSSTLDQTLLPSEPSFLPAPKITGN